MFALEKVEVSCTSASTNQEKQGKSEDTNLGMSMYFEFLGNNDLLDSFDLKLRSAIYERAADDQQEDMTGHLPNLKFKGLKPLDWPYIGSGYTAVIHSDLEFSEDFELKDCKVDKFQFTFKDEAVVNYRLRIYFHPELDDVGPLCALDKHKVTLSLIPPKVAEVQVQQPAAVEPSPQPDMIDTAEAQTALDALYPRALGAVRATGNPTPSALQQELKIDFNNAALLLARMFDEGIIVKGDDGEYHLAEAEATA